MDGDALLAGLLENPDDEARWLIYADWLLDHGHDEEATTIHEYRQQLKMMLNLGVDFATALQSVTRETSLAPHQEAIRACPDDDDRWHAYADHLQRLGYHVEADLLRQYLDDVRALWMDGHDLWGTLRTLAQCSTDEARLSFLIPTRALEEIVPLPEPADYCDTHPQQFFRFGHALRFALTIVVGTILLQLLFALCILVSRTLP